MAGKPSMMLMTGQNGGAPSRTYLQRALLSVRRTYKAPSSRELPARGTTMLSALKLERREARKRWALLRQRGSIRQGPPISYELIYLARTRSMFLASVTRLLQTGRGLPCFTLVASLDFRCGCSSDDELSRPSLSSVRSQFRLWTEPEVLVTMNSEHRLLANYRARRSR